MSTATGDPAALSAALGDLAVEDTTDLDSDAEVEALEDALHRHKKALKLALVRWPEINRKELTAPDA